jgi:hypothetical protein
MAANMQPQLLEIHPLCTGKLRRLKVNVIGRFKKSKAEIGLALVIEVGKG